MVASAPSQKTARTGAPYPASTQAPRDTWNFIKALGESLEKMVVPKFATTNARDTAIPAPVEGDLCWINATNVLLVHDGTGWKQIYPFTGPNISAGVGVPTGGNNGDVYLQYTA